MMLRRMRGAVLAVVVGMLLGCGPRLVREGDEAMLAKRPAEAAAKYDAALGRYPRLARDPEFMAKLRRARALAHYEAGQTLAQQGDWDDAVARFTASLAADPALPEAQQALPWAKKEGAKAHHKRAIDLADKGDLNAAIAELRRAQQLDPDNLDVKDALDSLNDKKAKNLSRASTTYHQGLAHAGAKAWGQAAEALNAAIAANPNHILARVARARAHERIAAAAKLLDEGRRTLEAKHLDRAIAAAKGALDIWPNYKEAKDLLTAATARRKRFDTLFAQAAADAQAKRWDDAATAAKEALDLFPFQTDARQLYNRARGAAADQHAAAGSQLLAQGKLEDAEAAFLRALRHVPDHRGARNGLAQADLRRGAEAERAGLWGSALLWYADAAEHLPEQPYTARLAQAEAKVLERVRFALAVQITGPGGRETPASAALRAAVMADLGRRKPDVVALGGSAPPLYGLAAELASLTVTDRILNTEQRVHHYAIAREVPNPDLPRIRQLLFGARRDLAQLRHLYSRRCPRCNGSGRLRCTHCRGGRVRCDRCKGTGQERCAKCKGTGTYKGKPCPKCGGTGSHVCERCKGRRTVPCPHCGGRTWIKCRQCDGRGHGPGIDGHDIRRKEREVAQLEWDLRRAPETVTQEFPAEWPYTVRRHERKGVIDIGVVVRAMADGAVLHTDRLQRNVPYYDTDIQGANPDIGLRPDPLHLPDHQHIGAELTTAAAQAIVQQALRVVLDARAKALLAEADALARDGNAPAAFERRVDHARILRALDPKAAAARFRQLSAARRTRPPAP